MIDGKLNTVLNGIKLLYLEKEIGSTVDSSKDLVKTVINTMKDSRIKPTFGGETNKLDELCNLAINIANNPESYDDDTIIQNVTIVLKDLPNLVESFSKYIKEDFTDNKIRRNIGTLRNSLNDYYTRHNIVSTISKANYQLASNKLEGNVSLPEYVQKLITNLEAMVGTTNAKDPGIIDEIDLENTEVLEELMVKAKSNVDGDNKFKLGFEELMVITQGGFRPGECIILNALQHNYKSGMCQSLFLQLPRYNKPILKDPSRKPLIVYVSLEDDSIVFLTFMYKYLYNCEYDKNPDLTLVNAKDMANYIKEKLTANGFSILMLKVNPSEWSIKSLFNTCIKLEAKGYEIKAWFTDYLAKMPTTGCTNTGPGGTDVRDMLNRYRNFFSSREAVSFTPHQISTEAKQLIRNGVSDTNFVKEIAGKGYTELSKQLDQVVDLELYIHKAKINGQWHLTIMRGKHRTPNILDDDKMYGVLPFPKNAPIKENIGKKLQLNTSSEETFDF